ncbi:MAG: PLP-dependent aminotransferase family protein, partial [Chloroflexota bacterium]
MAQPKRGVPNTLYLSLVSIDVSSDVPLYRQIYSGLRDAIVNGRLAPNTKLPSTRDLASIWNVSRNTLRNAFDQLIAEGYLDAGVGRGTFVVEQEKRPFPPPIQNPNGPERIRPISPIGRALEPLGQSVHQPSSGGSAFAVGVPDINDFPHKVWTKILTRVQRRRPTSRPPQHVNGLPLLREALASYLISARGLQCTPEQIDIVPGSVSGMFITALSVLSRGEKVWIENPCYLSVSGVLRYRGIELVPIPVDNHGMVVEEGIAKAPEARLAYVTPSHQYPLGETMSLSRRQQLLDWAGYNNSWIFEDDYDSEFRYDGPPISAIQGLDQHQRVIYFGTFSKILMPEIRLGYVVLPPDLVDVYTGVKMPISFYSPTVIQETAAEFMLE